MFSSVAKHTISSPRTVSSPRNISPVISRPMATSGGSFDKVTFESKRLAADEIARNQMVAKSKADMEAEASLPGSQAGAWKWEIRKRIWDMMEEKDIARPPRPVHHRIPNFQGADQAANLLASQPFYKSASVIKVNPDTPQKPLRVNVLASGKRLLTPQPRLRTGFFSVLSRDKLPPGNDVLAEAATSAGVAKYGLPIDLDEKIKVDLIVVGSTCVTEEGARLGKGEGFAELEYGILRWMGAVDDSTLVVTTVNDAQVVDSKDIPRDKLLEHDVPVDVIVTNTRVIFTNTTIRKPKGILWDKLSPQKLAQIRILRDLKERIERETGQKLPTGPDEVLPPLASRNGSTRGDAGPGKSGAVGLGAKDKSSTSRDRATVGKGGDAAASAPAAVPKESNLLFLSNMPYHVSATQIRDLIEDALGEGTVRHVTPLMKGLKGRSVFTGNALVEMDGVESARAAVEKLEGRDFMGRRLFVRFDRFT